MLSSARVMYALELLEIAARMMPSEPIRARLETAGFWVLLDSLKFLGKS